MSSFGKKCPQQIKAGIWWPQNFWSIFSWWFKKSERKVAWPQTTALQPSIVVVYVIADVYVNWFFMMKIIIFAKTNLSLSSWKKWFFTSIIIVLAENFNIQQYDNNKSNIQIFILHYQSCKHQHYWHQQHHQRHVRPNH